MNTLGLYIKEALQDKSEICLPGIGTFKKERIPAFFNDLKQCFMPPQQNIVLNEKQQESNHSLIEFIAEKEGINLDQSRSKLEQSLSELEYEFESQDEILLKGLGILKKSEGNYEFTYYSGNPEGVFNDYEPIKEAKNLIPIEEKIVTSSPAIDLNHEQESVLVEEIAAYEEDPEEETSSRKWLWPAIALIVCAAIGGFWYLNPNFNFNELLNTNSTVGTNTIQQSTTEAPAIESDKIESQIQSSESAESIAQDSSSHMNNLSEGRLRESQGRFEIIIAAFHTMEEAESYVNRTNAKGYNVYILKNDNPGNLNKISYGSSQTAEEADLALKKVREELTKDAWIYENKKIRTKN